MLNSKKSPQKQGKVQSQPKLHKLISKDPNFEFIENGKIRCIVTGHEMLPTVENYQNYLKSRSFKRGTQAKFDISQYEDVIIPHKESKNFLFCQLTRTKLPRKKSVILRHIQCKKFQRRYQQFLKLREQADQKKGKGEADEQNEQEQQQIANEKDQAQEDQIESSLGAQQQQLKSQKVAQGKKNKKDQKNKSTVNGKAKPKAEKSGNSNKKHINKDSNRNGTKQK